MRFTLVSTRNHKYEFKVHQTTIHYINETIFQSIDVSKVRSLGKDFGIFSGESPQSFGGEHHTANSVEICFWSHSATMRESLAVA